MDEQEMKTVRYTAWAIIVLLAGALTFLWLSGNGGRQIMEMADTGVGGPFALVRTDGAQITDRDLLGEPHALFFGFTNCPEICPATLYEASIWLEKLGDEAEHFSVYFVTVDPERDTREVLANYMAAFPEITAMTGSNEEVANIQKAYKVYSQKVPLDEGGYTMDHTATVFLMDAKGNFSGTIAWNEDSEIAMEKIRRLIQKSENDGDA
jgi:protein SCO1